MGLSKVGQANDRDVADWTHPVMTERKVPRYERSPADVPWQLYPIEEPPDAAPYGGGGEAKPKRLLEDSSEQRKKYPIASGLLDYFPDACAAVAEVSYHGNEKHNPGEPLHWARGKSMDHADCIARHLVERGGYDGAIRHSAALAWRALALLQEELEAEKGFTTPRGATDAVDTKGRDEKNPQGRHPSQTKAMGDGCQ